MVTMLLDSSQAKVEGPAAREAVRRVVLGAGFHRVGFAACAKAAGADHLRRWVERGFAGSMEYIPRSLAKREDPRLILDGARTVIAVALHYCPPRAPGAPRAAAPATDPAPAGAGEGRIAAYARGADYHPIIEKRLAAACELLKKEHAGAYRYYVDTGPVLERDWAHRAGIGWIGKNTCAIDPVMGSYFFIGTILTTLEIEPDPPAVDHCGTCRLCIDACPTGAIVAPHELDARRCISYLTIEHRGPLAEEDEARTGNLVFGCDICQEVCPFNQAGPPEGDPELAPRPENLAPDLAELALDEEGFRRRFPRSAVRRARGAGFLRNVILALGNSPTAKGVGRLRELARRGDVAADPVLGETAARALRRAEEALLGEGAQNRTREGT